MAEFNNLLDQSMILDRQDLTSTEKLVAVVILSFRNSQNGRCNPPVASKTTGKSSICTRTGLSRACVLNAIQSLEKKNVFVIQKEVGQTSNFICRGGHEVDTGVNVVDPLRGVYDVDTGVYEVDTGGKRSRPEGSTSYTHNKEITNNEQRNNKEEKESKEKDSFSLTPVEDKPQRRKSLEKPFDVSQQTWDDFNAIRKAKKAPLTETAIVRIRNEAKKAGITIESALQVCCERGWQGFKADWYVKTSQPSRPVRQQTIQADPTPEDFSDNQISLFAYRISREKPYTVLTPGYCESYEQLQKRIESQLRHPENFKKFIPVLRELHLIH